MSEIVANEPYYTETLYNISYGLWDKSLINLLWINVIN